MNKTGKERNIILGLFLVLTIFRIISMIHPESRLWAFHHPNFLPDMMTYLIALLSIVVVILLFSDYGNKISVRIANCFNNIFFGEKNKILYRFIFILGCTIIFILNLAPTHFLGDGYSWLNNLTGERSTIFKWSESGSTIILTIIQSLLGEKNIDTSLLSFQIVSVVSGSVTVWFYFGITAVMADASFKRFMIFITLFLSGTLLMFFGYVENYPLLFPIIAAFLYYSLLYIKNGRGLIASIAIIIVAVMIHMQAVIFLPGFLLLLFSSESGIKFYRKFRFPIYGIVLIILMAGGYLFYKKYTTSLYFENMFLPLFTGKPLYPEYALLSWRHFLDIFNELLLVSPLLPFLIFFSTGNGKSIKHDKPAIFFLLISLSSLLFLAVIDPKLGMYRDWDLFALTGLGVTLLALQLIPADAEKKIAPYSLPLFLIALIAVVPFLAASLNTGSSEKQIHYIIELDHQKSLSSAITLRTYYNDIENKAMADSANVLYEAYNQNEYKINRAFQAIDDGDFETTAKIMKTIKPDKFNSNYHNLVSTVNMHMGRFENAIKANDNARQLRAYDIDLISNRAQIFNRMKYYDSAMALLKTGFEIDPQNKNIIEGLAYSYRRLNQYDSAYYYAVLLTKIPRPDITPFYLMARIAFEAGKKDIARKHIEFYINRCQSDNKYETRSKELQSYLDILNQ